jgi:hypothetical protein
MDTSTLSGCLIHHVSLLAVTNSYKTLSNKTLLFVRTLTIALEFRLGQCVKPSTGCLSRTLAVACMSALKDVTCRFIRRLRCYGAIEVDLRSDLEEFTVKAAYAMLVGKMPLDDDVLLREMRTVEKLIRESRTGLGEQFDALMLPWLRVIRHSTWKQTQTAKTKQECLWTRVFERGQDGYHPEKAPSCIVHAVTQLLDEESPYYDSSVKWADAKTVFLDVLMGGVRTATSDSSYSLLGFLANQPQV